ncbi:MAG: class I SAM-dependent methyltransferase [Zavarzinella sp.]|nr:class I SAM-dependent methyltransferase [Zavarzinella sp.]
MTATDYERFARLTFDGFRELATADGLSRYERIGFPDSYRDGYEAAIYRDVLGKLSNLQRRDQTVFDLGCGCSDLPFLLTNTCERHGHRLVLCDSAEMLAHLPNEPFVRKAPGCFPRDSADLVREYAGRVDAVLVYSVLQYVFVDLPLFAFLDACLALLAPGGQLLIGDVPNVSKRKRFFASAAGVKCHQTFTGADETPDVAFNVPEPGKIDDAIIFSILGRARAAGFDAYVVPQAPDLPMANRREDILIARP